MKIIITFLLSITFISLNACSSKVIPIQGTAKNIEVKIENADQDAQYQLFSSSYEGVVDKKNLKGMVLLILIYQRLTDLAAG